MLRCCRLGLEELVHDRVERSPQERSVRFGPVPPGGLVIGQTFTDRSPIKWACRS